MDDLFDRIGREAGVRALVDRFYDAMDSLADAADIRALHPDDLSDSRLKLYEFLVGWTGGPQLYVEKRGHPRLRARHLPFPIASAERDAWMRCMRVALADPSVDADVRRFLDDAFLRVADHMRNHAD